MLFGTLHWVSPVIFSLEIAVLSVRNPTSSEISRDSSRSKGITKETPCTLHFGDRGGTVVKVLCYKSEGRWFDPSWCHWNISLT